MYCGITCTCTLYASPMSTLYMYIICAIHAAEQWENGCLFLTVVVKAEYLHVLVNMHMSSILYNTCTHRICATRMHEHLLVVQGYVTLQSIPLVRDRGILHYRQLSL